MPSPVVDVLRDLERALSKVGLRWYLFGAQAAIFHGVTSATADLDITVDLGEQTPSALVDVVKAYGFLLRVESRVLPVVHRGTSLHVDLVLAGPGLEELFFDRVESIEVEGERALSPMQLPHMFHAGPRAARARVLFALGKDRK